MVFLDFEQPVAELQEQLEKLREQGDPPDEKTSKEIKELEEKIREEQKTIYSNLTGWQRVQLSRHPERPYTLYYISQMCNNFIELHGDRNVGDDKAIVGGLASIDDQPVMIIGHQ